MRRKLAIGGLGLGGCFLNEDNMEGGTERHMGDGHEG